VELLAVDSVAAALAVEVAEEVVVAGEAELHRPVATH
jgi:hypothetical protein